MLKCVSIAQARTKRLLSASVSRVSYRRFLLLLDVEVRFDCAGSHKLHFQGLEGFTFSSFASTSCYKGFFVQVL